MTSTIPTEHNGYAAISFGAAALLVTGLQPILLGGMILDGFISLSGAGLLAMIEVLCIALGAGIVPLLLSLRHIRRILIIALAGLVSVNLLSSQVTEVSELMLYRTAAGVFSGVMVWAVTATLVRMSAPDRRAGIYLAISTLIQATLVLICALYVAPIYGWRGIFLSMAACSALPFSQSSLLIPELTPLRATGPSNTPFFRNNIAVATSVLFHLCAVGCIWAFLEPLGVETGISPKLIELTVAVTLLAQVIGGLSGAWLSPHLSCKHVISAVAIIQLLIALNLYIPYLTGTIWFCSLAILFGGLWLFVLPFQFGFALEVDQSGRLATTLPALQLLGGAVGPLTVSLFISETASLAALLSVFFLVAVLLMLLSARPNHI